MTAPSGPVRPADEETVQALAEDTLDDLTQAIYDGMDSRNGTWAEAIVYARAVVASEPWQRLVRERDEARAAVARVEALADEPAREAGHLVPRFWVSVPEARAALRGYAEEASEERAAAGRYRERQGIGCWHLWDEIDDEAGWQPDEAGGFSRTCVLCGATERKGA